MNSRIPNRKLRIQTLVALGSRSAALLAQETAVADLAQKMTEATERLVRAQAARLEAGTARFGAGRDVHRARAALVTAVRIAQHTLLLECGGTRSHPAYRAMFPRGQQPLLGASAVRCQEALGALEVQMQADPAHADLAKRVADAMAAFKAAVEAHVAARAREALAVRALDQARAEWTTEFAILRSEVGVRLRNLHAAKAFFPTPVPKGDDGEGAGGGEVSAGASNATGAGVPKPIVPATPGAGASAVPQPGGSAPPPTDLNAA